MDLLETVDVRCREIGLDDTKPIHGLTTLRAPARPLPEAGAEAAEVARTTSRELPRISVDVYGTFTGDAGPIRAPGDPVRDLEVTAPLGEGGMGRVFLARQHSLDRDVAIKTLRDRATEHERRALIAEGAITGFLEHPAIVPVHALGLDERARPVLVMKRVVGVPWSTRIDEKPGDLDEHLAVLVQVCNAVEYAHSKGILHRDIKPQNVLVGAFGEVQLCDFGVALRLEKARDPLPMAGTPAYMAPEMVASGVLDARTDVYLLGATLHHVLTGQARHLGKTVRETLLAAAESKPFAYAPSVPTALAALANAATARDPADRPASVARFRQALVEHLRHKSSVALAASAVERVAALRAHDASLDDEQAQRRIDVIGAEARLALGHALAEWPENTVAAQALSELDALLSARRARAAELERLAHDLDPGVSRGQRVAISAVLSVLAIGLAVGNVVRGAGSVSTRGLFLESLVPLLASLVLLAMARRHVTRNAVNRRASAALVVFVAAIALGRGLATMGGVPPSTALLQDHLVVAAGAALLTVYVDRWYAALTLLALASAVVAARAPDHAVAAFGVVSGAGLVVATLAALFGKAAAAR